MSEERRSEGERHSRQRGRAAQNAERMAENPAREPQTPAAAAAGGGGYAAGANRKALWSDLYIDKLSYIALEASS